VSGKKICLWCPVEGKDKRVDNRRIGLLGMEVVDGSEKIWGEGENRRSTGAEMRGIVVDHFSCLEIRID